MYICNALGSKMNSLKVYLFDFTKQKGKNSSLLKKRLHFFLHNFLILISYICIIPVYVLSLFILKLFLILYFYGKK